MSEVLLATVTAARAKSTGELAVVLNDTIPTRLPVPARTNWTNREAASRASWIFGRPDPPSTDMLPERSNTIITSRVAGGGGVGAKSGRIEAVGKYRSEKGLPSRPQGSPNDKTPRMRPTMSNSPEPELPPET